MTYNEIKKGGRKMNPYKIVKTEPVGGVSEKSHVVAVTYASGAVYEAKLSELIDIFVRWGNNKLVNKKED